MRQHRARKRFGQNFLVSEAVLQQIMANLSLQCQDHWIEIGPGLGALTQQILPRVVALWAIEIDRDLAALLRDRFAQQPNFHLIEQDVLTLDWQQIFTASEVKFRLVGNLPYNISTPILLKLAAIKNQLNDVHVMLQKEVAERLVAAPGSKAYGRLSIMLQYDFAIKKFFDIPPEAFEPRPKVTSSWLQMTPLSQTKAVNRQCLERVVKQAFNQRRKKLSNSLQALLSAGQLQALGIDPNARAEALNLDDYIKLANFIDSLT